MTVFSCLRPPLAAGFRAALLSSSKKTSGHLNLALRPSGPVRCMSGDGGKRTMEIKPSRFEWERFKDDLHYFLTLGIVPILAIVLYANIRIGPAELAEIPEGYVPHSWEYVQHPIQRWFMKYVYQSYEKSYEKMCHIKKTEENKQKFRLLEKKVKELERKNLDYKGWYYVPIYTEGRDAMAQRRREVASSAGKDE